MSANETPSAVDALRDALRGAEFHGAARTDVNTDDLRDLLATLDAKPAAEGAHCEGCGIEAAECVGLARPAAPVALDLYAAHENWHPGCSGGCEIVRFLMEYDPSHIGNAPARPAPARETQGRTVEQIIGDAVYTHLGHNRDADVLIAEIGTAISPARESLDVEGWFGTADKCYIKGHPDRLHRHDVGEYAALARDDGPGE